MRILPKKKLRNYSFQKKLFFKKTTRNIRRLMLKPYITHVSNIQTRGQTYCVLLGETRRVSKILGLSTHYFRWHNRSLIAVNNINQKYLW